MTIVKQSISSVCQLCGAVARKDVPHPEVELRRCTDCGHCFADLALLADRQVYDQSYGDAEHQNWFENPNIKLFQWISDAMGPDSSSVIDLGCGRAQFLSYLRENRAAGQSMRLMGVEQTVFDPPDGVEVIHDDLATWDSDEQFDAAVSLAVIEHVDDPLAFLTGITRLVRPGGLVVIMTLNDRSLLYLASRALRRVGLSGPFNQLYSQHHLHHFTKESLARAMTESGLEVVSRLDHNVPASAVDFPSQGFVADQVRMAGVRGLFAAGRLTGRCYLQTIVARTPVD